jgi:hypothetical protein
MVLKQKERATASDRIFISVTCMCDSLVIPADPLSVWRIDGWARGLVIMADAMVPDRWGGMAWHFPLDRLEPVETLAAEMDRRHFEPPYRRAYTGAA